MAVPPHLQTALQQGLALHRQGRLAEAGAIYDSILRERPGHVEALSLRGAVALQAGELETAVELIGKAIAVNPNVASAQNNLGAALRDLKRPQEALACYDRALALNPKLAEVHSNRGNALFDLKRFDEAVASFDKSLALDPNQAGIYNNRGNALCEVQRFDEGLSSYEKALSLNPEDPSTLNNRAAVLTNLKRFNLALADCDKVLAIDPSYAEAHGNRGSALLELNRLPEALASYDRAIALKPDYAEAHYNRGKALSALARPEDALASYDKALSIRPDYAEAYINRGNILSELKRLKEARASYENALGLTPDSAEAHYNLGNILLDQGEADASLASYERAIALRPDFADAHCNLIFALNFLPEQSTASQQARRKAWNETVLSLIPATPPAAVSDVAPKRGKLRIGYVSAYFRHQAATYAFAPAIIHHDRNQFEVFCYSDTKREDDVTALLKAAATNWRSTRGLTDEQFAEQIRADRIDILVDCVGHMKGHRLLAFARKPAPIQVTGWGEPTGTGLAAMDYLLADPVLMPPAERPLLSEAVIDLPCFLGYWSPDELPSPGPLPASATGDITFGSFNRAAKLTAPTLELWAKVLAAVPTSRLLLKSPTLADPAEGARLIARAAKCGIAAERIALLGDTARRDHFLAYNSVDICLDPLPHSGGMTTLDALWMGLPVITLKGATPSGRLAASVLTALDLAEWIAEDTAAYIAKAAALAADLTLLSGYRRNLRARVQHSAIGDPPRYAKAVEARFREIWDKRRG